MAVKLNFFDFNGIAEPIRYLLHYGGQKFDDIRFDLKLWPDETIKKTLPFGQMPLYEEDGKRLTESLAIVRYVGYKLKLGPTDPMEQAVLDSIALTIYDFWKMIVSYVKEKDVVVQETIKKEIINESVDFYFSRFEQQFLKNKGYFSGKLTWVDFVLVGIVEASNLILGIEIQKKYPSVGSLMKNIVSLPGVKEYVASRKPYVYEPYNYKK